MYKEKFRYVNMLLKGKLCIFYQEIKTYALYL